MGRRFARWRYKNGAKEEKGGKPKKKKVKRTTNSKQIVTK